MTAVYLPPVAVERILKGDDALLIDGLKKGLKPSILWPMWDAPLLHGICIFCPPRSHLMVDAILKAGEGPDTIWNALTPLSCAVGSYDPESGDGLGIRLAVVSQLAKLAAQHDLETAARIAIKRNYEDALFMLLDPEIGLDINGVHEDGNTLLHEAYRNLNQSICLKLIEKGALANTKNKHGDAPRDMLPPEMAQVDRESFAMSTETPKTQRQLPNQTARL